MIKKISRPLQPHIINFDANPIDAYLFVFALPAAIAGWLVVLFLGAKFTTEFTNQVPYVIKIFPALSAVPYFIWWLDITKAAQMIRALGFSWLGVHLLKMLFIMIPTLALSRLLLNY